jgi:N-acetylglucosaminyldiphosphoundecaprenol N-acetyl-beta-D-mannosaminyltransferase
MSDTSLCIFGVRIDNLSRGDVIKYIHYFLEDDSFNQITTINPEFLLEAYKNDKFLNVLNNSNLNVADGIGIKFAFWRWGRNLKARYTGIDLMWDILEIANTKQLSICLVANKNGLSTWQETREAILKRYPQLKIVGNNVNRQIQDSNIQNMEKTLNANIIFVNFGAPEQELFLNSIKGKTSAKLGLGIGGSFDYITTKVARAPKFMRNLGLEWLYRFVKQPHRFGRIWKAVIIFPIRVIFSKNTGQKHD